MGRGGDETQRDAAAVNWPGAVAADGAVVVLEGAEGELLQRVPVARLRRAEGARRGGLMTTGSAARSAAGMATAERTEVKLRNEQRVGLNYDISVQYGGLHVFASVGRPLATCG